LGDIMAITGIQGVGQNAARTLGGALTSGITITEIAA